MKRPPILAGCFILLHTTGLDHYFTKLTCTLPLARPLHSHADTTHTHTLSRTHQILSRAHEKRFVVMRNVRGWENARGGIEQLNMVCRLREQRSAL